MNGFVNGPRMSAAQVSASAPRWLHIDSYSVSRRIPKIGTRDARSPPDAARGRGLLPEQQFAENALGQAMGTLSFASDVAEEGDCRGKRTSQAGAATRVPVDSKSGCCGPRSPLQRAAGKSPQPDVQAAIRSDVRRSDVSPRSPLFRGAGR